jgi:hypothetical protein
MGDGTFGTACSLMEAVLQGSARQAIVADVAGAKDFGHALRRLRDRIRAHVWRAGGLEVDLARIVSSYDARTRQEGFHVLNDWDGKADRVNEDIIPVDVLHYLADRRGGEPPDEAALAILLDYYFLHVLSLFSLRVWDDGGDADERFDRLNRLLANLQGPGGSGQLFADNAETLVLLATSHYELRERGYDALLDCVRTLDRVHRTKVALGHASSMGCHLRFGFEAQCGRDTAALRDDNVADYPWLCFALAAAMDEYARMLAAGVHGADRDLVVEAMLNGLTADARAFVGDAPAALSECGAERSRFRERFQEHRRDLLDEFERHRPSERTYSPLSFFFNFSHNVLKGTVVDAMLWGEAWDVSFDDMLTGVPRADGKTDGKAELKTALATTLMNYARANPDTIRGRLMPVIVYDPDTGRQAFAVAMRKLREQQNA